MILVRVGIAGMIMWVGANGMIMRLPGSVG